VVFQAAKSIASLFSAAEYIVPVLHQFRLKTLEPTEPLTLMENVEVIPQMTVDAERLEKDNAEIERLKNRWDDPPKGQIKE
jgi:hypothetical protein